jgi:hypothetical protein
MRRGSSADVVGTSYAWCDIATLIIHGRQDALRADVVGTKAITGTRRWIPVLVYPTATIIISGHRTYRLAFV